MNQRIAQSLYVPVKTTLAKGDIINDI